jgi:hypothetical protein
MDVNRLFTARSGQQFRLELSGGDMDRRCGIWRAFDTSSRAFPSAR